MFKVRSIINIANKSVIVKNHIYEKAKSASLEIENFIPDYSVRWNTSYLMLERFYKLRTIVNEITLKPELVINLEKVKLEELRKLVLNDDDWDQISLLIKVLKPFYKATVMLQGQKYQSLSMSTVVERLLLEYFQNFEFCNANEYRVANILNCYLNKYLVDRISEEQKRISLVNELYLIILKFYKIYNFFQVGILFGP